MKRQQKQRRKAVTISATVGQAYANRLLILTEVLALLYVIITGIILLIMRPTMPDADTLLLNRVEILVGTGIFALLYYRSPSRFTWALRIIFQLLVSGDFSLQSAFRQSGSYLRSGRTDRLLQSAGYLV